MLIICAGMLRSGSTVQRQIVSELIKNRGIGETIAPISVAQLQQNYAAWAASDKWYVYKIHEYVAMPDAKPGTVKVLTTVRDLYDVTVSLMHFLNKDFEETIHSHEWTSNIPNFLSWLTAYPDLYISIYANLVHNLSDEVLRIVQHLGLYTSRFEEDAIADVCSLQSNRNRIAQHKPISDVEFMAERQIYKGASNYAVAELNDLQIKQINPLAMWWKRFLEDYT